MSNDNTHDLVGALHLRAHEAASDSRTSNFRARALEAAFAQGVDDRAWARVRLAADLRADGDTAAALGVLDDAWLLGVPEDAECAIFTVAIAVHCDLGAHPSAEVIELEQADRLVDAKFARAAARLYSELVQTTGDDAHRRRRDHYLALISELESADAAMAA